MSVDGFNALISKFKSPRLGNAYKAMQYADKSKKEAEIVFTNQIINNPKIVAKAIKQAVKGSNVR